MTGKQQERKFQFKDIRLLRDDFLGIGAYGKVCKAKCDDLLCAAKLMHETLFSSTAEQAVVPEREQSLPMRRFEQECEFLSTIRHPNIVQYLCLYQDPYTHLPVLLMELMDDSLTHFLESSLQPLPYHIQVNLCHDVAIALSFLHSNDIVHRDLSSNNVLMFNNIRAKVSDFGMARLGDISSLSAQHLTFTMCPGTDVYMPPEAVKEKPVYTDKIDCFSFGVIAIQIMTRLFPKPGDRRKKIEIENIGSVEKRISECERRHNHIAKVDSSHPLLSVALHCLKDKYIERPSAHEICTRLATLKKGPTYSESTQRALEGLQQMQEYESIKSEIACLKELVKQKNDTILAQRQEIQLQSDLRELVRQKDKEIHQLREQYHRNQHLQQQSLASGGAENSVNIKLKWHGGSSSPFKIAKSLVNSAMEAVVDGDIIYLMADLHVYSYNTSSFIWSKLQHGTHRRASLTVVNNLITLIGGDCDGKTTNKLFSLTRRAGMTRWTELLPPMPTKRRSVSSLCTGTTLIVAGGVGDEHVLATTEVMNTETRQWSTAIDLPEPMYFGSLIRTNDRIYVTGRCNKYMKHMKSAYTCSLSAFLQSCHSRSLGERIAKSLSPAKPQRAVWRRICDIPVRYSSYASLRGQLLAVGGLDSHTKTTSAVHAYDPARNSWEIISYMATPRQQCYAAVLPDDKLIVIGGETSITDEVEIAAHA
jgi:serine/threonine protein kinase